MQWCKAVALSMLQLAIFTLMWGVWSYIVDSHVELPSSGSLALIVAVHLLINDNMRRVT